MLFIINILAYSNWSYFQGDGLDTITDSSGFYNFKLDDKKYSVVPQISTQETIDYTTVTITTFGTKTWVQIPSPSDDMIFGMGEQFSFWNLKGKMIRNVPREDGIGRQGIIKQLIQLQTGKQELSASYIISPHFITKSGLGLVVENEEYAEFDFRNPNYILLKINSPTVVITVFHADTIIDHVRLFTLKYGRQPIDLPEWTQKGAMLGLMGGSTRVNGIVDTLLQNKVDVSAVWIQDWCGLRRHNIAGQLHWRVWWDWQSDNTLYQPSVREFAAKLQAKNIKVLGYINPFLVNATNSKYFNEAIANNYAVKYKGKLDVVHQGPDWDAVMIDLLNPKAYEWFKALIIKELFTVANLDGFMSDFGEYYPYEYTNSTEHIKFVEKWSLLNKELKQAHHEDTLIFMRSGTLKGKENVNLYWSGDQMHIYNIYDGLAAVLNGYLQASISGFGIMHSDIGGITTVAVGISKLLLGYKRSFDVLIRWSEMNVFESVLRTHDSSLPLNNQQVYTNEKNMKYFKQSVDKYNSLKEIRMGLYKEYEQTGLGLFRPLYMYYPNDKHVWAIRDQFLYGENILVAPILKRNTFKRKLYLPDGTWVHVFSKKEYRKGWVTVDCAYGKTAIFVKKEYYGVEALKAFLQVVEDINIGK